MDLDASRDAGRTSAASRLRRALRTCADPAHLRRTVSIAIVVGVLLTLVNQLDVLLEGAATTLTGVKIALNFCIPFVVANVGLLAAGSNASTEHGSGRDGH